MEHNPDILVLGGGGSQGDSWMTGVLAGLQDAHGLDVRECEYLIGTSAGAIVAARLAAGRQLRRPVTQDAGPVRTTGATASSRLTGRAAALAGPFAQLGLRFGARPGAALRAAALRAIPLTGGEMDLPGSFPADGARFDGRLRVVAVERASGRRVVFGAPGAPQAGVAEAVAASCAIPMVFSPVLIDGREYVDGAVWSPTNADAAPAGRDAQVLVLAPMAGGHGPFSLPVRAASRAALALEISALRARGARVRTVTPDESAAAAIGVDLMSRAGFDATLAAGYDQGRAL